MRMHLLPVPGRWSAGGQRLLELSFQVGEWGGRGGGVWSEEVRWLNLCPWHLSDLGPIMATWASQGELQAVKLSRSDRLLSPHLANSRLDRE